MTQRRNENGNEIEHDEIVVTPEEAIPQAKNEGYSNTLRVKADPPDATSEERKKAAKNLAGAIAHGLRQYGEVYVRCFSNATGWKASKAIAIARGYVAVQGFDLYCAPSFITADIGGAERTGICYWVFTNQTNISKQTEQQG
jgi:stage V sporulation protein S